MNKKIINSIRVALCGIVAFGTIGICGCSGKTKEVVFEISNYEELKSISLERADSLTIKLTADIDCGYKTLESGLSCNVLDGQGYSIKNCYIVDKERDAAFVSARGIFTKDPIHGPETTYKLDIKNITFENISVTCDGGYSGAVVACRADTIDNVHVKNCSVSATPRLSKTSSYLGGRSTMDCYVGGIYGGYYWNSNNGNAEEAFDCVISNCTVENTTVELTGLERDDLADIYAGGIAGKNNSIVNCTVKNSTIAATSKAIYCSPYIGGIVGLSEGNVEKSASIGNTITGKAQYYSTGAFNLYSTSDLYIGGAIGYSKTEGKVDYSYAENNEIVAKCSGEIYAGGLVGALAKNPVSQSYAKSNTITLSNSAEGDKQTVNRKAGGLVGVASSTSIASSWAYNDKPISEMSTLTKPENSVAAGFVATVENTTFSNCAVYSNKLNGFNTTDEFCHTNITTLHECYVSAETYSNINNCNIVEEVFWISNNSVKTTLNLMGSYWQFTAGTLPKLVFDLR